MIETGLTAGAMSALIMQGIKWIIRYVKKDSTYDFPQAFYLVGVPVLNVLVIPLLALLGMTGYSMPTNWVSFVQNAVVVLLSSLASVVTYSAGIKPLKDYRPTAG